MYHEAMPFNHYAKLKQIIKTQAPGWYIKRIDEPTSAKTFSGETREFDHYYRLYDAQHQPIKYGKFQQLDRLSSALQIPTDELPLI